MQEKAMIRNRRNGVVSEISFEKWEEIKDLPEWKNVFSFIGSHKVPIESTPFVEIPPEVKELEYKKSNTDVGDKKPKKPRKTRKNKAENEGE